MTSPSISPQIAPETLNAAAAAVRALAGLTIADARTQIARRLDGIRDARFYPQSLTREQTATCLAVDAGSESMLLQLGGAAGANGLSAPLWADSASGQYLYSFGSSDYGNIQAFAERIDRAFLPR